MPRLRPSTTFVVAACAWLALLPTAPAAQATRPLAGFGHAYAHGDCAPWDGSAIQIVLQGAPVALPPKGGLPPVAYPRYVVRLWTGRPPLGRWIAIPGKGDHGMGSGHIGFARTAKEFQTLDGRVRLDLHTPDRLRGELRLRLPGGQEATFPFDAPFLHHQYFCG